MTMRTASCGCGSLTARAEGDPIRISVCHCLECKRRTGSAFSWNATYPADRVETDGPYDSFERGSDEGYWGRHHFCPRCGATVYYEFDAMAEFVAIPVGAFADPAFPPPSISIYETRMHGWVVPPADAQHMP